MNKEQSDKGPYLIYIVDAFTKEKFKGNAAGVCIIDENVTDLEMQLVAKEMNLSETAFLKASNGKNISEQNSYLLRWFSPLCEVSMCGHATLASSKVIFNELGFAGSRIFFETKSGVLSARKNRSKIVLDFPIDEYICTQVSEALLKVMGVSEYSNIITGKKTRKLVIHMNSVEDVLKLKPDFQGMKDLKLTEKINGVAVTAKGKEGVDFVSRYFNPWIGINEDPVTGSVHTVLGAYWGRVLNKSNLLAYQASERGGELELNIIENNRIEIAGEASIIMNGKINL